MVERWVGSRPPRLATASVVTLVYCLLAAVSISTAYIQTNAAAVWMPSGFAVGLLTVLGARYFAGIAIGAFIANLTINLMSASNLRPAAAVGIAVLVAVGNTGEALLGAWLARRYAGGPEFLWRPRHVAAFVALSVTLAPLVSMAIGVFASDLGGLAMPGSLSEVMLTWYIADAVGILIFASLTILLMTERFARPSVGAVAEAALFAACIGFAGGAMSGLHLGEWLKDWPKAYMVIPLLLWACFRFRVTGALFAIALILLVSVIGTMRGFEAFPAGNPSRSLIYLQIFLGMLTVMSLSIAAALSETDRLRASLEDTVRVRTRGLEALLRERDILTTLVAHDLQSPLYSVRNVIKAVSEAITGNQIKNEDVVASMAIVEQTCSTIADRITTLLANEHRSEATEAGTRRSLGDILASITRAHELALRSRGVALEISGHPGLAVGQAARIEHILDILIDNAIRHSARGAAVSVAVVRSGRDIEVRVTNGGDDIPPGAVERLFLPRSRSSTATEAGSGLGLYLAREQATRLGGALAYRPARDGGAEFYLSLPVEG